MSSQTLTQVLSKLKHGTIIRHQETFENVEHSKHYSGDLYWVNIGHKSRLLLHNTEELECMKPFTYYCIMFKVKGKAGFYHCDEHGLFDTNIRYDTLSQFSMANIRTVWPKFNTVMDCLNKLEYFDKESNEWIVLSKCPIPKPPNSGRGRPKTVMLENESSEEKKNLDDISEE